MSQKQFKALRNLAERKTVGKPVEATRALYKQLKKKWRVSLGEQQAKATPIRTRSHYKVQSYSGDVPKACIPTSQPFPKSRITKGYRSDSYSHTKGFKKQSTWVRVLLATGFTPWTMGML